MYRDDDLDQAWLEKDFLDAINKVKPDVCRSLDKTVFGLYKEIETAPETWEWVKYRLHEPEVKALSDALDAWAVKWCLTPDWCKASAYFTLQIWKDIGKPHGGFWHHPGSTYVVRLDPPEGLPMYYVEFGRDGRSFAHHAAEARRTGLVYLKTLEDLAREAIVNHPLLKLGESKRA